MVPCCVPVVAAAAAAAAALPPQYLLRAVPAAVVGDTLFVHGALPTGAAAATGLGYLPTPTADAIAEPAAHPPWQAAATGPALAPSAAASAATAGSHRAVGAKTVACLAPPPPPPPMPCPVAWASALSAWAAQEASDWSAWDPDTCPDDAADDAAQQRQQRNMPPPKQLHGGEAKTLAAILGAATTLETAGKVETKADELAAAAALASASTASSAAAAWAMEREWNRALYPGAALAEYGTPGGGQGLTVTGSIYCSLS